MTLGTALRAQITSVIGDANFKSDVTITPRAPTAGTYGGYNAVNDNESASTIVDGIPYQFFADKFNFLDMGNVSTGDMRLILKYSETVDIDDKITFNTTDFNITEIRDIVFNDVVLAKVLVLSKRLE